jgi:hypothetical protein
MPDLPVKKYRPKHGGGRQRIYDKKAELVTFVPEPAAKRIIAKWGTDQLGYLLSKAIIEYERNNSFRYDEEN